MGSALHMKLAIMQPYFLPYIGYFHLMAAVDKFVILDDVNFINRGWINRNRISVNNQSHWLTVPLVKASQNRLINEVDIVGDDGWKAKMLRTVEASYTHAPFAETVLNLFTEVLANAEGRLSTFLFRTLRQVASYVGTNVCIVETSAIYPKGDRKGQHRILDICLREGATTYVNPPGGRELYDSELFGSAGVELLFLDPSLGSLPLRYSGQEGPVFSVLDLMMLNSQSALKEAIGTFRLLS
jgi:WbqC-like protein family